MLCSSCISDPRPHSKPKAHHLEEKILSLSGLDVNSELEIQDIPISYPTPNNFIHTTICGHSNSDAPLVLLHGFGGTGVLYYPMLKQLSQEYKVFCLDMLGLGLSSRPNTDFKSAEEGIEFFVESLEHWRKSVGLETFYLGGHSYGGYMACQYALKYPNQIKKLFLLSPCGVTDVQDEDIEKFKENLGWMRRKFFSWIQEGWEKKYTPQKAFEKYPIFAPFMLKRYVNNRFNITKKAKEYLYDFLLETFKLPSSGENSLHYVLKFGRARAAVPLEPLMEKNLKVETIVYYGDKDWMDTTGAKRLKYANKENYKLIFVRDSGHQITVENPDLMAIELLKAK